MAEGPIRGSTCADSARSGTGTASMPGRRLDFFRHHASMCVAQPRLWFAAMAMLLAALSAPGKVVGKALRSSVSCAPFDLYVWAGPDNWTVGANDLLLVYTVKPCSHKRPSLKWKVDIGTVGNEPHHLAFNKDRSFLFGGGLLSFASGLPSLYFFRTNGKRKPVLMHADSPPNCTAVDAGVPLSDGGMLISCMGGAGGGIGGQLLIYNKDSNLTSQFPPNAQDIIKLPPYTAFNPHGIAISSDEKYILSSDFVVPISTVMPPVIKLGSVRVFDAQSKRLLHTLQASTNSSVPMGAMDVVWVNGYGIALCTATGKLYWVDAARAKIGVAYDFQDLEAAPELAVHSEDEKQLYVSVSGQDKVVKFNSRNPKRLVPTAETILPKGAGPHFLTLSPDGKILILSDYFLDEKNVNGVLRYPGDKQVRFIATSTMKEIAYLQMDFTSTVNPEVVYRPHGMQVYPLA